MLTNFDDTASTTTSRHSLAFEPHIRMPSDGKLMGPIYHKTNTVTVPNRMSESTYSLDYTRNASRKDVKKSFRIDTTTVNINSCDNEVYSTSFVSFLESIINRKAAHVECLPAEILDD